MRKHQLILLLAPALALPLSGATKIFLKAAASVMGSQVGTTTGTGYGCNVNTHAWGFRQATTTQGSSTVTETFAPTSTAPPCIAQQSTASANFRRWITAPITTGFTLSGNIDYSGTCSESAAGLNGGFRYVVQRWSRAVGGLNATIMTSATSAECNGTLQTIAAAAPTSTTIAAGDRLVIFVETMNVGTWGGNGTRTWSWLYDGAAAGTGDAFANFADTFSFDADSNTRRTIISTFLNWFLRLPEPWA